jgi:hypothetical protein
MTYLKLAGLQSGLEPIFTRYFLVLSVFPSAFCAAEKNDAFENIRG